jgi:hypothetical protein
VSTRGSEDTNQEGGRAGGAASNAGRQEGEPAAANKVSTNTTDKTEEGFFTLEAYKSHIDLYKFGLEYAFKAITIFFLLAGGVLTFGLSPDKASTPPDGTVIQVLLITTFLVNIAMILGFALTAYLWIRLSQQVRKNGGDVNWKAFCEKPETTWYEFVVRLYSPSLGMMLVIVTILFIIFSILLGWVMAEHKVLFCASCLLRWPIWILLIIVASIAGGVLLMIKFGQSWIDLTERWKGNSEGNDPVREKGENCN